MSRPLRNGEAKVAAVASRTSKQWTRFDFATVERVAAHEPGHAVGLTRSPDKGEALFRQQRSLF